jgi:excisionase family DNA binding protein
MIDKPWLTVHDAAAYAAVSLDTIYTACERGKLRHVKVGGRKAIRLRVEWIDEWLERHATGGIEGYQASTVTE